MASRPRRSGPVRRYSEIDTVYPDGAATTAFERRVHCLNKQAFPLDSYGKVDDILVYSLFASKRASTSYRAMCPEHVSDCNIDEATGIAIRHACYALKKGEELEARRSRQVANDLVHQFPCVFNACDVPIVEHLLARYQLLYSDQSPVQLEKVSFGGGTITAGIKAKQDIPAAIYLLTLCGSMSRDVSSAAEGVSLIQAMNSQLGPQGVRMLLGPFRFINHDCNPNAQISWIKKTHAFTVLTLRTISAGESITVKYDRDGYFGVDCRCASCHPEGPPVAPRRKIELKEHEGPRKKPKRSKRGGRNKRRDVYEPKSLNPEPEASE